jgi:metallo-beta-lactamase class B
MRANRRILGNCRGYDGAFLMMTIPCQALAAHLLGIAALLSGAFPPMAQDSAPPSNCASCVAWNAPQRPFHVYGNTYYIGTHELSSILITTDQGLVVIDGDLPESGPQIAAHIRELGFDPKDIKLILNSHVHFDHAGGIFWLQKLSGARVAASPWSAEVLRNGGTASDDPQHDLNPIPITPVARVETIQDRRTLHVGNLAITAHFTPGHTPGGTSWTWQACEKKRCLRVVYVDSLTAVSANSYRFLDHPALVRGFEHSFAVLNALPCDILLTPHPGFSDILGRLKTRNGGNSDAFVNPEACRRFAALSQKDLEKRFAQERTASKK